MSETTNQISAKIHCEGIEIPGMCRITESPRVFVDEKPQFSLPNTVEARITTHPDGRREFECDQINPETRACRFIQHFTRNDVDIQCPHTLDGDKIKQR